MAKAKSKAKWRRMKYDDRSAFCDSVKCTDMATFENAARLGSTFAYLCDVHMRGWKMREARAKDKAKAVKTSAVKWCTFAIKSAKHRAMAVGIVKDEVISKAFMLNGTDTKEYACVQHAADWRAYNATVIRFISEPQAKPGHIAPVVYAQAQRVHRVRRTNTPLEVR
jgi:hypothetical protein